MNSQGAWRGLGLVSAPALSLLLAASARGTAVPEVESNDTFGTAGTVAGLAVAGSLSLTSGTLVDSRVYNGNLSPDATIQHLAEPLSGHPSWVGKYANATVNNSVGDGEPDTVLGYFLDAAYSALGRSDDDSSPVGNGFGSALYNLPVLGSGQVPLAVTGSPNTAFAGTPHFESGGYSLTVEIYSSPADRIDFHRFTGLNAGAKYDAVITSPSITLDTLLGSFNPTTGALEVSNDDFNGPLSKLSNLTPSATGELVLAVTGFGDSGFNGLHGQFGDYELTLTQVPEPAAVGVAMGLLLAGGALWRRGRGWIG